MTVEAHTLRHLADLARLEVDDDELAALGPGIQQILGYVARIADAPEHPVHDGRAAPRRADTPVATDPEPLLHAAPQRDGRRIKVPPVLALRSQPETD